MAGYSGFPRPDLSEIRARVHGDLNAALPTQNATLRFSPLNALSETVVGASNELYGYLDWIARQTNVLDCDNEQLDKFGQIWGVARNESTYASGFITVTGTTGAQIPQFSALSSDAGGQYITTAGATIYPVMSAIAVKSTLPGSKYNILGGENIALAAAISGVNASVSVVNIGGGLDRESDDSYRKRILHRIAHPPAGGSKTEWEEWTREYTGITRVWCSPQELGTGTVTVRVMLDNSYADGIPQASDLFQLRQYLEKYRPVTSRLFVFAPVLIPQNVVIMRMQPDTIEIRAAVVYELQRMFQEKAVPGQTLHVSWIWSAVAQATGATSHLIIYPEADVIYDSAAYLPVCGIVTFQ